MTEQSKSLADQIGEISKLVTDAQDKLDQVVRALRSLEQRIDREEPLAD
jgi:peptidoglycan hydrolase CwlO-like protein